MLLPYFYIVMVCDSHVVFICLCLWSRLPWGQMQVASLLNGINYPPTEFLQQNRPGIVLTSVAEPLPEAAQSLPVTMYVAGFPCQPYSSEGVHLGWKDSRWETLFAVRATREFSGVHTS